MSTSPKNKLSTVFPKTRPQWALPKGRILRRALRSQPSQEYLLFVPTTGVIGAPVLVSMHGISRNAVEQAQVFAEFCENRGAVLLVPIFTKGMHDDYQRLGQRHSRSPAE